MSLPRRFTEARETLGVSLDAGSKEIRRAYRRLVAAHPPDRDPEGFQRVRAAYELLVHPTRELMSLISHPRPYVACPELPATPAADPHRLHRELLKVFVRRLDIEDLLP